jgi:hypothetical protein
MLRNVLVDYLNRVSEREFDLPFLTLLSAMGYYDIHYTHGQVEFGKDFIAKKIVNGHETQFSFQLKAGNIDQSEMRNSVMSQMFEALLIGLSHPQFSKDMPHQAILVLTGNLIGNSGIELQNLNETISNTYKLLPILVWDFEPLLCNLKEYGLEGLYNYSSEGFSSFGDFYILYGKCLRGEITDREIEKHSRKWLNDTTNLDKKLLGASIESEIIAQKCIEQGLLYEAIQSHLSIFCLVQSLAQDQDDPDISAWLAGVYIQSKQNLYSCCNHYLSTIMDEWKGANKDLVSLLTNRGNIITYLVHCARIIEIIGCQYFLETNMGKRKGLVDFLIDFINNEPGCKHIPSDRYAISLILPNLALYHSGHVDKAIDLIRGCTIWLCDRYQDGSGIAPIEETGLTEISILFGQAFTFNSHSLFHTSFLVSVLCDLAAFINNELYSDVVNDCKACNIIPQYWQVTDSQGLFRIDSEDIIYYPNIEYKDNITQFDSFDFAEHIIHEQPTFRIIQKTDSISLFLIMLHLRDRYFPTIWPLLVKQ